MHKSISVVNFEPMKYYLSVPNGDIVEISAKVIDTAVLKSRILLTWQLLDAPFKELIIDDSIFCMGETDSAIEAREKLFRFGIYHKRLKQGAKFNPKDLIGIKALIRITKEEGNILVTWREGETATEYAAYKYLKAYSKSQYKHALEVYNNGI